MTTPSKKKKQFLLLWRYGVRNAKFCSRLDIYLFSPGREGEGAGGGGGGGRRLEVPGLIFKFPQFITFLKSIREHLGLSIIWLLTLTF